MLASLDLRVISFLAQPTWRSVRCCAVLCCAVLCCAVLCCAVLCCAVLCCAVLCCAVMLFIYISMDRNNAYVQHLHRIQNSKVHVSDI